MKRLGESEEVANAVLFAASDYASYITGTFIEIAGGKFCVQNPSGAWDS
jgi:3-oxoacyl-[acyl-carrier protein] reductase